MKQTRILMGMPITIEVVDAAAQADIFDHVFAYFTYVDQTFSTYKAGSEISRINKQEISVAQASQDVRTIFALAEQTKQETSGYFDILRDGVYDPSGIVKGWSIYQAANIIRLAGYRNFSIDAGGDIQAVGQNSQRKRWRVGIRNPFTMREIVKVLAISNRGVATSGVYIRGQHIYNPKTSGQLPTDVISLTVIGPNIYEADRFATAAFAMGEEGIRFIERLEGFEGYMIDQQRRATFTSGFTRYLYYDDID
jgi:FAD:protein FMN transferase